ncbi:MAG TPA: hypothetical protein VIU39_09000 [Anaerolineales bacterium]|jgi:hypothetical protein
MNSILPALLPITLLAFWAWMFADMLKNEHLPECFVTFTGWRDPRSDWSAAFVLLSIITAIFYYVNVYRKG